MAIHVLPINDLKEHTEDSTCECNPSVTIQHGEMIICHKSFDKRKIIEEVNNILNNHKNGGETQKPKN
jgi:hypothetical protein